MRRRRLQPQRGLEASGRQKGGPAQPRRGHDSSTNLPTLSPHTLPIIKQNKINKGSSQKRDPGGGEKNTWPGAKATQATTENTQNVKSSAKRPFSPETVIRLRETTPKLPLKITRNPG